MAAWPETYLGLGSVWTPYCQNESWDWKQAHVCASVNRLYREYDVWRVLFCLSWKVVHVSSVMGFRADAHAYTLVYWEECISPANIPNSVWYILLTVQLWGPMRPHHAGDYCKSRRCRLIWNVSLFSTHLFPARVLVQTSISDHLMPLRQWPDIHSY